MLESLINPKKAEKRPWEMFLIGLFYGSISMLLAYFVFAKDVVNSQYIGWIVVMFCVIFSMPFIYYTIRLEERKDEEIDSEWRLLREHGKALLAFLWLFVGFVVAFSFWHMALPDGENLLRAQISTFCQINQPDNYQSCLKQYNVGETNKIVGNFSSSERLFSIFSNNVYVLIFALLFSIIMGAGAIFVLAWNASVIAAAIGIFASSNIMNMPLGLARYMIHGLPEIAAYFIGALAGGILSVAIIRHEYRSGKFWGIVQDSLNLIVVALIILFISALIEVFITPKLF